MPKKRKLRLTNRTASPETEALNALNVRTRRRRNATRLIEASIEANAKRRRQQETPASSAWKPAVWWWRGLGKRKGILATIKHEVFDIHSRPRHDPPINAKARKILFANSKYFTELIDW